ncbi:nucleophosmin-like isoform X1 [Lethenteron reissneri]|uniref:nucleophosmin-like isoform X1 n=1 Tax=Lethenteron reissneri TaxID=7753 RepID=UPI002AB63FDD|nr:nucleophosmin-like isoform X1 [Lethenteron reissneri]XP_061412210.1 nucleophosmin-like isoform X1 [Lethenteron reissneri]
MAAFMDDSADMESLDDVAKPQSYIFGCELNAAKKVYKFNPEDDDDHAEMHLMLSSVCVAPEAEDRFHVLEVTTLGKGGKPVTIPIATLKPSVLPSLSLSGFDLAAPVVLTLKCGSGPVYISGQHVAYPCNDFHDDDDDDDDDDEEEPPKLVPAPKKRPAPFKVPQIAKKKTKLDEDDEDDEDDDDDDDDSSYDDDDDDDDDDDEDEEEVPKQKVLVKAPTLGKAAPGPKVNGTPNKKPEPALAKTPVKADKTPAKVVKPPAKVDKTAAKVDKTPAKVDKTPAKVDKTPAKVVKAPAKVDKTPAKAEKTPAKAAKTPVQTEQASSKEGKAASGLKTPKSGAESKKGEAKPVATPGSKTPKTPKSPKSPKGPISLEEVKTKLKEQIEKNMGMPKTEEKFGNFLKSSFKVEDTKVMKELWSWSLTQTKS